MEISEIDYCHDCGILFNSNVVLKYDEYATIQTGICPACKKEIMRYD